MEEEKYRRQVCTELLSLLLLKVKSLFEQVGFYAKANEAEFHFPGVKVSHLQRVFFVILDMSEEHEV